MNPFSSLNHILLMFSFLFLSMASTVNLHEKHFLCSLCRNIFTNPVTTPCGHSFCLSCLSQFWSRHQSRYCPECRRLFPERPNLSVNHILANVAENYKKVRPQKTPDDELVTVLSMFLTPDKSRRLYVYSCWIFFCAGSRCHTNDSGKTAEDRPAKIFSGHSKGTLKCP